MHVSEQWQAECCVRFVVLGMRRFATCSEQCRSWLPNPGHDEQRFLAGQATTILATDFFQVDTVFRRRSELAVLLQADVADFGELMAAA